MPRRALIDRHFSAEEQSSIAAFLDANPTISVDDFRALLRERGAELSRSTAHAAKRKLEAMGGRLRESRRMMDAIATDLEGEDESRRHRALLEIARTLCFEFQQALLDGDASTLKAGDLAHLGRSLKDLMQAARLDQDYAARLVEQATKRAAQAAGQQARKLGLSEEGAASIRAFVEGGA